MISDPIQAVLKSEGFHRTLRLFLKPTYRLLLRVERPKAFRQALERLESLYRKRVVNRFLEVGGKPVVMFVAWSLEPSDIERLVDQVRLANLANPNWEPVFVTNCDRFDLFNEHSFCMEYIPSVEEWCAVNDMEDWQSYLDGRMRALRKMYDPRSVVLFSQPADFAGFQQGIVTAMSML